MRVSNNPPNMLVSPDYIGVEDYYLFATRVNNIATGVLKHKYITTIKSVSPYRRSLVRVIKA